MRFKSFIYSSINLFIQPLGHCILRSRYKDKWNWSLPLEATIQIPNPSHPGSFSKYSSPGPQPRHSDSESLKVAPKKSEVLILGVLQVSVLVRRDNKWREPRGGRSRDREKGFLVHLFQEALPDQPSTLMSSDPNPHCTSCKGYSFPGWLGGLVPLVLGCVLTSKAECSHVPRSLWWGFQGLCDTQWLALFKYGRSE